MYGIGLVEECRQWKKLLMQWCKVSTERTLPHSLWRDMIWLESLSVLLVSKRHFLMNLWHSELSTVDVSSVGSPASALGRSRAPAPARTEEESSHSRQANIIETTTELLYLNWYNLNDLWYDQRVIKTLTADVVVVNVHCTWWWG